MSDFNDSQLLRYSRQILLPQLDIQGQEKLQDATALIVGLGGLGSPVALYLAAAGVGKLILVDDDQVELSNLQRQIVHTEKAIGKNKAASAGRTLKNINSDVHTEIFKQRLDDVSLAKRISSSDVVLDCTDNFTTRKQINALCVQTKTPLVSGAAIRLEGQVSVFDMRDNSCPCYECLYQIHDEEELSCVEAGVLSTVVGVVGTCQAHEAIKVLASLGRPLKGELAMFDGMSGKWRYLTLKKDPQCPVCRVRD